MKFIKRLSLYAISLVFVGAFLTPAVVLADDTNTTAVCNGLALTGANCSGTTDGPSVDSTVKLVINILSLVVGVAAVIMIIIGGLKYIISQGEGSNTASAKNTILYAIIGLVIVVLAQVIVKFVLNRTVAKPSDTTTVLRIT